MYLFQQTVRLSFFLASNSLKISLIHNRCWSIPTLFCSFFLSFYFRSLSFYLSFFVFILPLSLCQSLSLSLSLLCLSPVALSLYCCQQVCVTEGRERESENLCWATLFMSALAGFTVPPYRLPGSSWAKLINTFCERQHGPCRETVGRPAYLSTANWVREMDTACWLGSGEWGRCEREGG